MTRKQVSLRPPDALPALAAGTHITPELGGCFMERASMLAGEPWSDMPRCTHPALAAVAQVVNDGCTDAGRVLLAPLVPDVIGLTGRDARLTPALVSLCLERAAPGPIGRAQARHAHRRSRALSRGGVGALWCRWTDVLYRRGPAERAWTRAVERLARSGPDADRALVTLLRDCIDLTGTVLAGSGHGRVAVDSPEPSAAAAMAATRPP